MRRSRLLFGRGNGESGHPGLYAVVKKGYNKYKTTCEKEVRIMEPVALNDAQIESLEDMLDAFDTAHMGSRTAGRISLGFFEDGQMIAGVDACMTAFHILYVSTLFVAETHRRRGLGRQLMETVEHRARELGANMIRLDTFDWQGRDFYRALGYETAGQYENAADSFSEFFFLKRL